MINFDTIILNRWVSLLYGTWSISETLNTAVLINADFNGRYLSALLSRFYLHEITIYNNK